MQRKGCWIIFMPVLFTKDPMHFMIDINTWPLNLAIISWSEAKLPNLNMFNAPENSNQFNYTFWKGALNQDLSFQGQRLKRWDSHLKRRGKCLYLYTPGLIITRTSKGVGQGCKFVPELSGDGVQKLNLKMVWEKTGCRLIKRNIHVIGVEEG